MQQLKNIKRVGNMHNSRLIAKTDDRVRSSTLKKKGAGISHFFLAKIWKLCSEAAKTWVFQTFAIYICGRPTHSQFHNKDGTAKV